MNIKEVTHWESKSRLATRLKFPLVPSLSAEKMSSLGMARICHSSPDKSDFHVAGKTSSNRHKSKDAL